MVPTHTKTAIYAMRNTSAASMSHSGLRRLWMQRIRGIHDKLWSIFLTEHWHRNQSIKPFRGSARRFGRPTICPKIHSGTFIFHPFRR